MRNAEFFHQNLNFLFQLYFVFFLMKITIGQITSICQSLFDLFPNICFSIDFDWNFVIWVENARDFHFFLVFFLFLLPNFFHPLLVSTDHFQSPISLLSISKFHLSSLFIRLIKWCETDFSLSIFELYFDFPKFSTICDVLQTRLLLFNCVRIFSSCLLSIVRTKKWQSAPFYSLGNFSGKADDWNYTSNSILCMKILLEFVKHLLIAICSKNKWK